MFLSAYAFTMKETFFNILKLSAVITFIGTSFAEDYHVAPDGSDSNDGSIKKPFKTLVRARNAVREDSNLGKESITVCLHEGTYYLDDALVFTPEDSGSEKAPVTYTAYNNESAILSGGSKLDLKWEDYRDGIMQAEVPSGMVFDQLFVNGIRQHMARYPDYDPEARPYNGAAADAFSPERAARWADPAGGFIHAMHRAHWGGYHYRITGKDEKNVVKYEGGWQNNRQMGMHNKDRFIENIFEELDAAGEWYLNSKTGTLYYYPTKDLDLKKATIEVARLNHLIELQGSREKPVKFINFKKLIFRHANRTFMETREPLLRSDWTIYRGGAVLITGAEDCAIEDCEFDQVGGNAVFVNKYNRRIAVRGTHIHGAGASGVCFVGDPGSVRNPLFEYHQTTSYDKIDKTPGPESDNYPADCIVDDCLIHDVSVVEKQATGVQISMSKDITVRHCSIYGTGRAGINISEGTFGGHLIEYCDVFDTVRETGDHGSFNSWGRDRFWHLKDAPEEELPALALLDAEKTIIRNSRWRCDHGWDIDLDDGSSNYEIYNNLMLNGGLKLREGFHRTAYNNITVNNGFHPHVWYKNSGDRIFNNIWLKAAQPIGMDGKIWGIEVDRNIFISQVDKDKNVKYKVDLNSIAGDPMFVDPQNGDYRVKPESPALKMGFKNFPMDQFGVQKIELKAIARQPVLPTPNKPNKQEEHKNGPGTWKGAAVEELKGEAFSAFGVAKEDGGIHLVKVPGNSPAFEAGLRAGDVLLGINGKATKNIKDLNAETEENKPLVIRYVRAQKEQTLTMKQ